MNTTANHPLHLARTIGCYENKNTWTKEVQVRTLNSNLDSHFISAHSISRSTRIVKLEKLKGRISTWGHIFLEAILDVHSERLSKS